MGVGCLLLFWCCCISFRCFWFSRFAWLLFLVAVRHGWQFVVAALGGVCLFRCCRVAFGLLLIGVPVFGLRCS